VLSAVPGTTFHCNTPLFAGTLEVSNQSLHSTSKDGGVAILPETSEFRCKLAVVRDSRKTSASSMSSIAPQFSPRSNHFSSFAWMNDSSVPMSATVSGSKVRWAYLATHSNDS